MTTKAGTTNAGPIWRTKGHPLKCVPHVQSAPRVCGSYAVSSVVMAVGALVYWLGICSANPADAGPRKLQAVTNETLPRAAGEMRDAILAATRSGQLIDLKTALELNEMRPEIADEPVDDPIDFFKKVSKDGEGHEILGVLAVIMDMQPAAVPFGRDIENNAIFVWPYLAERDVTKLTAKEESDLAKLMPADDASAMKAAKRWTWWRLAIGADGTWHSFRKEK